MPLAKQTGDGVSFIFGELVVFHVVTPILAEEDAGSITGSPSLRDRGVALSLADRAGGGGLGGGRHSTGPGIEKDCEKYSNAAAMGWSVLRVTSDHVKSGQAVDWIGKALEIRS